MKRSIPLAAAMAVLLDPGAAARAQDPPTYEYNGLPLTVLQSQVLGLDHVREQPPVSSLARDGLPASVHQLIVLPVAAGRIEQ